MVHLFPFASFTARNLDRKLKSISQVINPQPSPWGGAGTARPPGPNIISSALSYELLDVVVGLACSCMVVLHREAILLVSWATFEVVMITTPLVVVDWLNDWPIGLKLNRELSKFCSQTFLVIISSWSYWLPRISEVAFYGFACLGLLGASTLVAFSLDVIQVATLHLHMCHVIVTTLVHGLRLSTSTLWNLFQGKCYNQLCNRTDKWFYEMDHLVLGTIFFTLVTFLMPTILVYQIFFSAVNKVLCISLSAFDSHYSL